MRKNLTSTLAIAAILAAPLPLLAADLHGDQDAGASQDSVLGSLLVAESSEQCILPDTANAGSANGNAARCPAGSGVVARITAVPLSSASHCLDIALTWAAAIQQLPGRIASR